MIGRVKLRDPKTDPPPNDGTQAVWRYRDGETLAGETHAMYVPVRRGQDGYIEVDPEIVWWFKVDDLEDT